MLADAADGLYSGEGWVGSGVMPCAPAKGPPCASGWAVRPLSSGSGLVSLEPFTPGPGEDVLRCEGRVRSEASWADPRRCKPELVVLASGGRPRLSPVGWLLFESVLTLEASDRLEMSLMGMMIVSIESSESRSSGGEEEYRW